jgi:hypothetical protein
MKTLALLAELNREGMLDERQLQLLSDLHLGRRFSLHDELRGSIYAGVLFILAGLGLTIKTYFTQLGDIAIIGFLGVCCLAAFSWCFWKGRPFSREAVAAPNLIFDYLLFLGCTVYSLEMAYIETRFHLLGDLWVDTLLVSSALFGFLAYRFDNRLVLSLALSTLAAWFGFKLSPDLIHFQQHHRLYAIVYALAVFLAGSALYRGSVKRHFLDIYLNFAVHFLMVALVSGVFQYKLLSLYFPALILACAAAALYGLRAGRFAYLLYAMLYGYLGLSSLVVLFLDSAIIMLYVYFLVSAVAVIALLYRLSHRFGGRHEP